MTMMKINLNIQSQNLRTLSMLDYDVNLTTTQAILIGVGTVVVIGLMAWGIKKFIENI